ncbi:hypothetical protein [Lysinibacillus odysseyi]|uniref:Uncharacterized protein n=1 Tax=Lysinibacillus odysseyi 34hs-1 = NBRC 100172 TaxID=1220589 RepID=A0A0A3IR39_9BACI|nr:hypothetical protein [Lysinibacillus odysseyi]KGR85308.1 hypothetical protein CD32_08655 [Lysinibacillus odysseyi 34hs-1 = NBRC 100172]
MILEEPAFKLTIRGMDFFNEELSCLGWQFAEVLKSIKNHTENYDWYIFDVLGTSNSGLLDLFPLNTSGLCVVLSTNELIDKVKKVIQFESGVFIAVQKGKEVNWDFGCLPGTEESEGLQHPFAEIEIRAFDYSFFEFYGRNVEIKQSVLNHFQENEMR